MKPKISIVVAMAKNRAIGKNGQLLWHISNDLKHFKKVTTGKCVIMGCLKCSAPTQTLPPEDTGSGI